MAQSTDHAVHAEQGHADHGNVLKSYLVVFVALCIFTAVSFLVNYAVIHDHMGVMAGFVVILGVAVVKALLVASYFMHLKWDWNRLYFLIVPVCVLAPMLVLALLPDIVIYWKKFNRSPEAPAAIAAPVVASPTGAH